MTDLTKTMREYSICFRNPLTDRPLQRRWLDGFRATTNLEAEEAFRAAYPDCIILHSQPFACG